MSNKWKELKIGNLPSDILVGDYEIEFYNVNKWHREIDGFMGFLKDHVDYKYRYRLKLKKETVVEAADKWARDSNTRKYTLLGNLILAFYAGVEWQREQSENEKELANE